MDKSGLNLGLHSEIIRRVIKKDYPHREQDFLESFDHNQITCKFWLIEELTKVLEKKKDDISAIQSGLKITVLGSWYSNILVPLLVDNIPNIKLINLIDMDEDALAISRKMHGKNLRNVNITYTVEDINFYEFDEYYTNIVINTSCEHMIPMDAISFQNDLDVIWVLQSNNLFNIREHVNCVHNTKDLIYQANINKCYYKGSKKLLGSGGEAYNRFMIIGKR